MELERRTFSQRIWEFISPYFRVRPDSGKLWLDVVYLILIAALQLAVLPSLVGKYIMIDILTPWLVANFVFKDLKRGALVWFLGALIMETHSTSPKGLFFCAYWIVFVVIAVVKPNLSWRMTLPWVAAFFLSSLWVNLFEGFVVATTRSVAEIDGIYAFSALLEVLLCVGFGLLFSVRDIEFRTSELTSAGVAR
jgi:hypothetical protein